MSMMPERESTLMDGSRVPHALGGLLAAAAALATAYAASSVGGYGPWPVAAVAEEVIDLTPGPVAEQAIDLLGGFNKPVLLGLIVLTVLAAGVWTGLLARRGVGRAFPVVVVVVTLAGLALLVRSEADPSYLIPLASGAVAWLLTLQLLRGPARRASDGEDEGRRSLLVALGAGGAFVAGATGIGWLLRRTRDHLEETRELIKLEGVSRPRVPAQVRVDVPGIAPWQTPSSDFFKIDTTIVSPAIHPAEWRLRIHGMVRNPMELTYDDLLDRQLSQGWVTINCVSNEVGGDLVGNAWWSGVRLDALLEQAGVEEGADALLQTSHDGWTCGTPLSAVTDGRLAMLAVAMNGEALPIDHGFPVRTIVPGLYGFVSACKWVVDIEITRFEEFSAYWTQRGWAEQAPVRLASRIDTPFHGEEVAAGQVPVGGVAWAQQRGIAGVEVSLDGGAWQAAPIGGSPNKNTWVQWGMVLPVEAGEHTLRVRATTLDGEVQTGVEREVLPDGATGWHTITFTAE